MFTLTSVSPAAVCKSQSRATLTLRGAGSDAAAAQEPVRRSQGALPSIALRRVADLGGAATSDAAVALSDAASVDGAPSPVRWLSGAQINLNLLPPAAGAEGLATGLYEISVRNPDGRGATLARALTVVSPPTLGAITPAPVCDTQGDAAFTLSGADFIKLGDELPQALFALDGAAADQVVTLKGVSIKQLPRAAWPQRPEPAGVLYPERIGSEGGALPRQPPRHRAQPARDRLHQHRQRPRRGLAAAAGAGGALRRAVRSAGGLHGGAGRQRLRGAARPAAAGLAG